MSETQEQYDTKEPTGFPTAPWNYTDTHLPDDPQSGWAEATVWDSVGDLVCAVSTQMAGSGEVEHAVDRARLIAAAGTAAHEAQEMGYDPVGAVEALPELLSALEHAYNDKPAPTLEVALDCAKGE